MKFVLASVLSAAALVSAFPMAEPEPVVDVYVRQADQSINDAFVKKGKKYFGTCTDQGRLNAGSNAAIIKADFGQVTPENRFVTIPLISIPHRQACVSDTDVL